MGGGMDLAFGAARKSIGALETWELSGPRGARCLVLPGVGSQLGLLALDPGAGRDAVDVLHAPPPPELRQAGWGAGAPILFPFPGRITGGEYRYRGESHRVGSGQGRHPLHGFVGLAPWEVIEGGSDDHGAWVRTAIDHERLGVLPEAFPGQYRLEVTHRLGDGGYEQGILLRNTGSRAFPFGYGWHPYFRTPLLPRGTRADCTLTLQASARWELTADLVPTGRRLEVAGPYDLRSPNPLGDKSYDDPFTMVAPDPGGGSSIVLEDPRAGLRLTVWAESAFRDWVVYSPRTLGAVALEPYTCTPDAFNLEARGVAAGLRELEPGETWRSRITVRLQDCAG